MPKYSVRVYADLEVEAPNVALAYSITRERAKIIASCVGFLRGAHERDHWSYNIKNDGLVIENPKRIDG